MVNRFIRILIIILFCAPLSGCWLADYDPSEGEVNISGNIRIWVLKENKRFELVFYESTQIIVPIVGNCTVIYYDSLNSIVLAEEKLNKYNRKFNKIYIKDANNRNIEQALTLTEITAEEFNDSINDKMKKWSINNNE